MRHILKSILASMMMLALLYQPAYADGHDGGHGHGWHGHGWHGHGWHAHEWRGRGWYGPPAVVYGSPAPAYYAPPPVVYYAPPPVAYYPALSYSVTSFGFGF